MSQAEVNLAALDFAKSLRQIYTTVMDATIASRERNINFAQSAFERGIEELKSQTATASGLSQAVAQQTQKQREAFEVLTHQAVDAYLDYLHDVLSLCEQGLNVVRQATE
jgi:hypothetical protein